MVPRRFGLDSHASFVYYLLTFIFFFIIDDIATRDISVSLYQFVCHHIVGSEEVVKTKRTFITIRDNMSMGANIIQITSGSFGEGLEMQGSDLDLMVVFSFAHVYEDISKVRFNSRESSFVMDMDDCKLGFTHLRLVQCHHLQLLQCCRQISSALYLSNGLIKADYMKKVGQSKVIHGPCLSDKAGFIDLAISLHSKQWISPACKWISRPNRSWPSDDLKSTIIDHGTLFVPIGCKGSKNEDIEWRFSFSVGEKLLIYSFTHVQLMCYALMKILLKDVIDSDDDCKGLLCSYHIKNIIFWVSEELPLSIWRPENLVYCFMKCFGRLVYCVEYSMCPHYFIPEINMFESKIEGHARQVLLGRLKVLYSYGWRCILQSKQLSKYRVISPNILSVGDHKAEYIKHMLCTTTSVPSPLVGPNEFVNRMGRSPKLQSYFHYFNAKRYFTAAQCISVGGHKRNKTQYIQYRKCRSYLLYNIYHNSVSGWLMLASFYYRMKHYNTALNIVSYAVSMCTTEKVYHQTNEHYALIKTKTIQSISITRILKLLLVGHVLFTKESTLIPVELYLEVVNGIHFLSPVVYSNFMSFLCHFRLNNVKECFNALADLQLTISEDYFILDNIERSNSYNCLGVAFQLIGNRELAERAFNQAIELGTTFNCASQRLSMIQRSSTVSDSTL